jgi:hypothetical protein
VDSATIISDPLRSMVTATRQADGRILVRAANRFLVFTEAEVLRLADFVRGLGTIQRHPVGQ